MQLRVQWLTQERLRRQDLRMRRRHRKDRRDDMTLFGEQRDQITGQSGTRAAEAARRVDLAGLTVEYL